MRLRTHGAPAIVVPLVVTFLLVGCGAPAVQTSAPSQAAASAGPAPASAGPTFGTPAVAVTAQSPVLPSAPAVHATQTPSSSGAATGSVEPTSRALPDATEVAAARQLIETANLANDDTINALEGVRFTPAGEVAARAILASTADGDVLWAATWVYASSATDPGPLVPLLANADASIRVMAAATLIALGDRAGFAVLATSLPDTGQLRGSVPPMGIGSFALFTLSRYLDAPDIPAPPASEEEIPAAAAAWASWLGGHADDLRFDAPSRTWTTS